MTGDDDLRRENEALRGRFSTLNGAILRINAGLDVDTVLDEVVAIARQLTGARYGIITTMDETGAYGGPLFSGFTAEQQRELAVWPGRLRLFGHLRELYGPLRTAALRAMSARSASSPPRCSRGPS
ncbi:MAG: hypothetical protein OXN89_24140 [Bryobacterales bacterium]|nr:hypothetical protein [Bryobacterales bacterium]